MLKTVPAAIFSLVNLLTLSVVTSGPLMAGLVFNAGGDYFVVCITSLIFYTTALPAILLVRRLKI
jgi:hypothetical protein